MDIFRLLAEYLLPCLSLSKHGLCSAKIWFSQVWWRWIGKLEENRPICVFRDYCFLRFHLWIHRLDSKLVIWIRATKYTGLSGGRRIHNWFSGTRLPNRERRHIKKARQASRFEQVLGAVGQTVSNRLLPCGTYLEMTTPGEKRRIECSKRLGHEYSVRGLHPRSRRFSDSSLDTKGALELTRAHREKQTTVQIVGVGEDIGLIGYFPVLDTHSVSFSPSQGRNLGYLKGRP